MANPNIAALNELHLGTLSWELKSKQVILINSTEGNSQSAETLTYEHSYQAALHGHTLSDFLITGMLVLESGNNTTHHLNSVTHNGDATTWLTPADTAYMAENSGNSDGATRLWYRVAPDAGDSSNVYATANTSTTSLQSVSAIFANVDQTTPFKTMTQGLPYIKERTGTTSGTWTFINPGGAPKAFWVTNFHGQPGQSHIMEFRDVNGRAGDMLIGYMTASEANDQSQGAKFYMHGGGWGNSPYPTTYSEMLSVGSFDYGSQGLDQISWGHNEHDDAASTDSYRLVYLAHIQSSQTDETLITCPAERIVKVKSIRATNARDPGTYVTVKLEGLGTTILDTADADAVGAAGADATVTIAKDVRVPQNDRGIELISTPIYMNAGDILKGSVNSSIPRIEYHQTPANLVVTVEAMED